MRRAAFVAALLTVVGPATEASAFICAPGGGASLAWAARCVPVVFAASDPVLSIPSNAAAAEDGLALWTASSCTDFELLRLQDGSEPENGIYAATHPPMNPDVVAETFVQFVRSTGEIYKASIELNENVRFGHVAEPCEDTYDLVNVFASEMGTVLGFVRDPNTTGTIFGANFLCAPPIPSIGTDDQVGMCFVYPRNDETHTCQPPSQGYGNAELRPDCAEAGGAQGAACNSDGDCRSGLGCDSVRKTCRLELGARGCACSAPHTRGGEAGRGVVLVLVAAMGVRRRRRR